MNRRLSLLPVLAALALGLSLPASARAASIVWDSAQPVTGDSDVGTTGTLIYAINFGGVQNGAPLAPLTINGVAFHGATATVGNTGRFTAVRDAGDAGVRFTRREFTGTDSPFGLLPEDYRALLNSNMRVANKDGAAGAFTLTLESLTAGRLYEVQIWVNDSRDAASAKTGVLIAAGGAVHLSYNTKPNDGGGLGQFVTGSFVADGVTQSITFTGGPGRALISALQLRAIPHPGAR